MYGRIESGWEMMGDSCLYHFVVPANTSATLFLKAISMNGIREGKNALGAVKGVKYAGQDNGRYVFKLQPGTYRIQVKGRK